MEAENSAEEKKKLESYMTNVRVYISKDAEIKRYEHKDIVTLAIKASVVHGENQTSLTYIDLVLQKEDEGLFFKKLMEAE